MSNQTVSIIIPCFNQGAYLEECIMSVENQTYKDIEIIVVNDGSTEELTLKVLNNLQKRKPYIKIINIQNSGVSKARNIGINQSKGKYILPLDGDDKIHSHYIEKAVSAIEENKGDIIYCIGRIFDARNSLFVLPDYSYKMMLKRNVVFCTALFKREDYDLIGGYNENMVYGLEDWDFWLSMVEENKVFYRINEVLFYYRIKQYSRNTEVFSNKEKRILTYRRIVENHPRLYKNRSNIFKKQNIIIRLFNYIFNQIMYYFQYIKLMILLKI